MLTSANITNTGKIVYTIPHPWGTLLETSLGVIYVHNKLLVEGESTDSTNYNRIVYKCNLYNSILGLTESNGNMYVITLI